MIRVLISIPFIILGIFLLPAMGSGLIFLIPGLILFFTGFNKWSGKRSKQILTEAMIDAEKVKEEAKGKA